MIKISNFKFQISNFKKIDGFTFIELILYISIVTLMLSAIIPFAWNIIGGGVKSSAEQEVSSQARYVSERIKWEIRDATDINSVSATSISLAKPNLSLNPTTIDLSTGKIRITQGPAGTPYNLNSDDTTITSLTFINYSSSDNKTKHIQFTFTIDDAYGSLRQEYQVPQVTIESSAEVRNN